MKTSEILIKARDLIADPAQWTQHANARDEEGISTNTFSEQATCWCSDGALVKASNQPENHSEYQRAGAALKEAAGGQSYVEFNDTHTHAEVMTMFDTAIATAQARGD